MDTITGFPADVTLEDVREAIKGRVDFKEVTQDDYIAFVYFLGMAKDIFPDISEATDATTARLYAIRRECRGIIFDQNGKLLSRRFHKFFNSTPYPVHTHLISSWRAP